LLDSHNESFEAIEIEIMSVEEHGAQRGKLRRFRVGFTVGSGDIDFERQSKHGGSEVKSIPITFLSRQSIKALTSCETIAASLKLLKFFNPTRHKPAIPTAFPIKIPLQPQQFAYVFTRHLQKFQLLP
jgi:hypothetical protein